MGINDFIKNCVSRKDGRMVCWDGDAESFVLVELNKMPITPKDLTEAEIVALMKKRDANR